MMRKEKSTKKDNKRGETSKQFATKGVDYLSYVPREVMHHILLFLPFEYWIIMGMVSKQWKDLLRESPVLFVNENEIVVKMIRQQLRINGDGHNSQSMVKEARGRFVEFVNHAILCHSSCLIKRLRLSLQYDPETEYALNVNNWVLSLMTRDIEKLELNFSASPNVYYQQTGLAVKRITKTQPYVLPSQPFEPKFRSFILNFCKFEASRFESFLNLKVLYLTDVEIVDSSIGELASKCPILEELYLERCSVSNDFFICQQDLNIKHLFLINCLTEKWQMYKIDVSAPQLMYLVFIGQYLMSTTIRNATNLVECLINIEQRYSDNDQGNFLASVMINLKNCRSLALSSWCIQVISTSDIEFHNQLKGAFHNLKSLRLTIGYVKQELPGIILLLQSCPNLETLTLEVDLIKDINWFKSENDAFERYLPEVFFFEHNTYLENNIEDIPCIPKSLKVLQIYGFTGQNQEINVLWYLLQNAIILEKIVIFNKWPQDGSLESAPIALHELNKRRVLGMLQAIPMASSVRVSFENIDQFPTPNWGRD